MQQEQGNGASQSMLKTLRLPKNGLSLLAWALLLCLVMLWLIPKSSDTQAPQPPLLAVNGQWLSAGAHSPELIVNGRVEAPLQSTLRSGVTAYVASVSVNNGDLVRAGDLLIELDPLDASLAMQQATAEVAQIEALLAETQARFKTDEALLEEESSLFELLEKSVTRQSQLEARQLSSDALVEEATQSKLRQRIALKERAFTVKRFPFQIEELEARLAQAKARAAQAAINLDRTHIVAPYDGYVIRRQVAPGDRVTPGDSLLTLYGTQDLEVHTQLSSAWLSQFKQADSHLINATVTAPLPVKGINARYVRLTGEILRASSGATGVFQLVEIPSTLRLGQALQMRVAFPKIKQTTLVPASAVYELGDERLIYQLLPVDTQKDAKEIADTPEMILSPFSITVLGSRIEKGQKQFIVAVSDALQSAPILLTRLPNAADGVRVRYVQN